MEKYIVIVSDVFHHNVITNCKLITDEQIENYKPLFEAIKNSKALFNSNWQVGDYAESTLEEQYPDIDAALLESFNHFVPKQGEDQWCDRLKSIQILEVINSINLL